MSEKCLLALVFASCFNLLKSKVNPDGVPTNLGRRRFFLACDEALDRAGDEAEPHDLPLSCLAFFLLSFCIRVFCCHQHHLHHCIRLPELAPYRTFSRRCLTLWSISISFSSSGSSSSLSELSAVASLTFWAMCWATYSFSFALQFGCPLLFSLSGKAAFGDLLQTPVWWLP